MSAELGTIVSYLNDLLRVKEFTDFTYDGLVLDGAAEVNRVGFAVDASLATFEGLKQCDLIVVHHGMWWPSTKRITTLDRARLKVLIDNNVGLYTSHLPLDRHPQYGNNAQIIKKLGLEVGGELGEVGWYADLPEDMDRFGLVERINQLMGSQGKLLPFGSEQVNRLAVCSGGGGLSYLQEAAAVGADFYLTGEYEYAVYHPAREMHLNTMFSGHYATEVWGVQALRPVLEEAFGVQTEFFDHTTGL